MRNNQNHPYHPVSILWRNAPLIQYKRRSFLERHGLTHAWLAMIGALAAIGAIFTFLTFSN